MSACTLTSTQYSICLFLWKYVAMKAAEMAEQCIFQLIFALPVIMLLSSHRIIKASIGLWFSNTGDTRAQAV